MNYRKNLSWTDIQLLFFRITVGGMMCLAHGWPKLAHFQETATVFPNVFGLGSLTSLALTVFAEFFCALAVVLGLATRLALIPLVIAMSTAAFVVHGPDSFQKKELALVYLCAFILLFFTGSGRYTVGRLITNIWRSSDH